jgi:hypothetical protein
VVDVARRNGVAPDRGTGYGGLREPPRFGRTIGHRLARDDVEPVPEGRSTATPVRHGLINPWRRPSNCKRWERCGSLHARLQECGSVSTPEAFGIAGAVAFLILYFRAVSIRWPESYFRLGSTLENVIASGPLRYVSFRLVPVFASCLFVAVTVERAGGRAVLVVVLVTVIHLLITTGWATAQVLARRRHLSRRVPLLLAYSAVTIGVIGAAVMALTLRDELAAIVPKPAELSSTLWTAAFAGLAGAYVAQLGLRRGERVARSIRQSKAGVDERLWRLALDTARRQESVPRWSSHSWWSKIYSGPHGFALSKTDSGAYGAEGATEFSRCHQSIR